MGPKVYSYCYCYYSFANPEAIGSKELVEWHNLRQKCLNTLDLPNRKGWPQRHKVSSWARTPVFFFVEKEQSHSSKSQDCEEGEQHLDEKEKT